MQRESRSWKPLFQTASTSPISATTLISAVSGNCRMCLVDVKPGPPKLSISCATTVAEGMEIETENEKVRAARAAVMEFILKNHPLDCPICDQAGECMLHEYYMKYDLKPSRLPFAGRQGQEAEAPSIGQAPCAGFRALHPVHPVHPFRAAGLGRRLPWHDQAFGPDGDHHLPRQDRGQPLQPVPHGCLPCGRLDQCRFPVQTEGLVPETLCFHLPPLQQGLQHLDRSQA